MSANATMAEAMNRTACLACVMDRDGLTRTKKPGKRLAAKFARMPTPIPEENTTLKPKGRLRSSVNVAMAGEMATAQMVVAKPANNASARTAERGAYNALAAEIEEIVKIQISKDFRIPMR